MKWAYIYSDLITKHIKLTKKHIIDSECSFPQSDTCIEYRLMWNVVKHKKNVND